MKYWILTILLFIAFGASAQRFKRDTSYKDTVARNFLIKAKQNNIEATVLEVGGAGLMASAFVLAADRPRGGFPVQNLFAFVGGVCVVMGVFDSYNTDRNILFAKDRITGDDLKKAKARKDKEKQEKDKKDKEKDNKDKEKDQERLRTKKLSFYIGPLGGGLVYRF